MKAYCDECEMDVFTWHKMFDRHAWSHEMSMGYGRGKIRRQHVMSEKLMKIRAQAAKGEKR